MLFMKALHPPASRTRPVEERAKTWSSATPAEGVTSEAFDAMRGHPLWFDGCREPGYRQKVKTVEQTRGTVLNPAWGVNGAAMPERPRCAPPSPPTARTPRRSP